jgi:adenine-specific DNA methylase
MSTQHPKRLIEVDLPIKRISEHARREKSIRHGHISTLHIWWARRPLAACRAVICAALWPDPVDPECPAAFREKARSEMQKWTSHERQKLLSTESRKRFEAARQKSAVFKDPVQLRGALLDFIADFANWDSSSVKEFLETSRALTQAAHEALGGAPGTRPLVVDPFAGGGAIPLEALRVGADAFASDLNPIPVLLNKVVLEYIPKYGQRLADEVRKWGEWIKKQAEKELAQFYPKDADGATPIAYLWARTIRCEGPSCGAEVPLIRSLWLAKRAKDSVALKIVPKPKDKRVDFEIINKAKPGGLGEGTVRRSSATCPCCGYTTPAERTRAQFKGRRGGAADARLLAVVATRSGESGRFYRAATKDDLKAVKLAGDTQRQIESDPRKARDIFPDEPLPYLRSIFNIQLLDVKQWKDLFSPRQLVAISTLHRSLHVAHHRIRSESEKDFADAIASCLALAINRQADYTTSLCSWHLTGEKLNHTYGRQALGIIWDFAEVCPFANGSGNFEGAFSWVAGVCQGVSQALLSPGHAERASATEHPLPDDSAAAFFTDPPYYDAVPYADLSDFFYVWLKRALGSVHPGLFSDELTPKKQEVVQLAERNPIYAYKTKENFEVLMTQSLSEGRRTTQPEGIGVVVFAHKTTGAWETMLQAVIEAGWVIVASWPIDTEMGSRLRAMNSAVLASSVHLVCRPRENPDGSVRTDEVGDWRDVLQELPRRIHDWMPRLAEEGVVGADAIFACLGPALEIFSRYARVEKASGEAVALKEYLEQVWAAVAKEALAMIFTGADATGFEEDARLTAMWLWTLNSNGDGNSEMGDGDEAEDEKEEEKGGKGKGGFVLEYDAARKIAQGLGAHLEDLQSLVEISGETARLLPVAERANHLFGKDEGRAAPVRRKREPQMDLFRAMRQADGGGESTFGETKVDRVGGTVLDRIHQTMILFAAGRGEALKRFLVEDGAGNDQRFWRLAQALSALYPASTEEKRWVDGVLARKKGLGF